MPCPTNTPLSRSLSIQFRIIGALLMREVLTRYGRHNIGFLWLFVEPMLFTVCITLLWMYNKSTNGSDLPITSFAVTGYSSVLLWRSMPNRCMNAIEPNFSLMYHRNVKPIDLFISRVLLEIAGTTTSFVLLILIFHSVGWMPFPENILKVLVGWCMLAWFGAGLGLLIGASSYQYEIIIKIWRPMNYILFPLSGALFMVDWLPPSGQKLILLLPMVHGVELLREGYFGSIVRAHYDLGYMSMCCLTLTLFGIAQERIISRKITP